jgi:RNA-binding protein 25
MFDRLRVWDDDESDESFYTDRYLSPESGLVCFPTLTTFCFRARWRIKRAKALQSEQRADDASRALEARQAEHLRQESEAFLARQMDEMRSLAEEQRKAGLLLDDGAPVKLSISTSVPAPTTSAATAPSAGDNKGPAAALPGVFGVEEEEELTRKRKGPLVKLDFGGFDSGEARGARLTKVKEAVSKDKEVLWKTKIRWEALSEVRLFSTA